VPAGLFAVAAGPVGLGAGARRRSSPAVARVGSGGVVALLDLAALPALAGDLEAGQEQVGVGIEDLVDAVEPVEAGGGIDSLVADYPPDELVVFLVLVESVANIFALPARQKRRGSRASSRGRQNR